MEITLEITHSCEHTGFYILEGSDVLVAQRMEAIAESPCPYCREAESDYETAGMVNQAHGLPPLTGSQAQVKWAEKLRMQAADLMAEAMGFLTAPLVADQRERALVYYRKARNAILHERTEATWWIGGRHDMNVRLPDMLVRRAAQLERAAITDTGPSLLYDVFWPGRTTVMCEAHKEKAVRVAKAMGFTVDFRLSEEDGVCSNCENEGKK